VAGRLAIALVSVAALLAIAYLVLLPRAADHFGFVVRSGDALPERINYGGRDYWTPNVNQCHRRIPGLGERVGAVTVIFGADRSIHKFANQSPTFAPTVIAVEESSSCLVQYGLLSGP
jgi:hypothetical protein